MAQDIETLLRTIANPKVRSVAVDFIFIGDGERAAARRGLAEKLGLLDQVSFVDPIALDRVPATLRAADLLLVSYLDGGEPIPGMPGSKVYEYCASARPILVHGPGMATEMVRTVGNGWCCDAGNPSMLAKALDGFLSDDVAAEIIGRRGRLHAEREFDKRRRHDRWETLLIELTSGRATLADRRTV